MESKQVKPLHYIGETYTDHRRSLSAISAIFYSSVPQMQTDIFALPPPESAPIKVTTVLRPVLASLLPFGGS
ncbi:hypothetical protein EVAR_100472_1 [Eumeta japonica]|uniref:Uncharacterized protein n=1 Tax=Eumeta variegata TaxID=151549 RepID=A0A4C1SHR8_EUMVA|nr:hypothetical protein EVAR_100472_1 [Eumeta japonica]